MKLIFFWGSTMTQANTDGTEKNAVAILNNYFDKNGIIREISEGDRTRLLDGFLIIDNTKYDIQVKGTSRQFKEHSIKKKYFKYALSNFLVYIIVDNLSDGLFSKDSKAYYTVIDFTDATIGIKNDTQMTVNSFEFHVLDNINEFIRYIERKFDEYLEFRYHGIDLMQAPEYGNKFGLNGSIDDDLNLVDIKVNKVYIEDVPIKVFMPEGSRVETGLVQEIDIVLPNSGLKVLERSNFLISQKLLIYEELKITIFTNSQKYNVSINENILTPFRADVYENYINILENDFFLKIDNINSDENPRFNIMVKMIELKKYLIDNDIYHEKFNKPEIISYLLYVFENELTYQEGKNEVIFHKVEGGYIARTNYKDKRNFILKELLLYNIFNEEKPEIEYTGYSLVFAIESNKYLRQCINFDYIEMLRRDTSQLSNNLPEDLLTMLTFNYLLIYWEYNKNKSMLRILKNAIKKNVNKTKHFPLLINYMQIKKILGETLSQKEHMIVVDYANDKIITSDEYNPVIVKLVCSILLERNIECKKIYINLSLENKEIFDVWPIKYLYDELVK